MNSGFLSEKMNVAVSSDENPWIARARDMPSRFSRTGRHDSLATSVFCPAASLAGKAARSLEL